VTAKTKKLNNKNTKITQKQECNNKQERSQAGSKNKEQLQHRNDENK